MNQIRKLSPDYLSETHQVENQPFELSDYNLFTRDAALQQQTKQLGADWAHHELADFGEKLGQADYIELGFAANHQKPEFFSHDRYGRRTDLVKFHPAYHQLMKTSIEAGLHASPWTSPRQGAHVARAAKFFMQSQIEAAHGCPITMTFASVATIKKQADIATEWLPKITAPIYQSDNIPYFEKQGLTIGMAMTEKQGGSDVRANSTRAYPLGKEGPGQLYELVGHKYFVSAPMCDAFLLLANTDKGLSCFLLPRWRPDGSKNPMQIQQLKNKMGNVANASSETELRGALAWMIGEEGRGIANILEMVALTRFDCMIGSSAGMRMAVSQITHHCHQRMAFGKLLDQQPLMQNVLADLIIEQQAALAITMQIAHSLDQSADDSARLLTRIGTAVGKYWICKRTPGHAYEAMECIGGSGVMEDSIMPRLFRESPVNSIWEGSGNVQCLDVLRAIIKEPGSLEVLLDNCAQARGAHPLFDDYFQRLKTDIKPLLDPDTQQQTGRSMVDRLAQAWQAATLLRFGDDKVAEAYCRGRLSPVDSKNYGCLPVGIDFESIIERARP